jgi:integrase/recombinase XerC
VNDTDRFLAYLRFEKRFSEHTIIAYSNDLQQYLTYLSFQYQVEDATQATHFFIRSWIVSLMESGMDARSVNRKITTLRTFYRFLIKSKRMERSPMLKVQAPKVSKKLPEYLDEQKMIDLLEPNKEEGITFEDMRNLLILDFFYRTGIRLSELINLKTENLNLYNLTVTVLGKRNKVRQIPITMNFKKVLEEYLGFRAEFLSEKGMSNSILFPDNKGNQMAPGFVYRIVKSRISKVSTGKKRSPHILRHSFATSMLNNGADINAIKELLGHSSLAATQVYTHNSIEKLKEIYKQAFPKA